MTTIVSLRRSLRKIPDFASLSSQDLDAVIAQMVYRDYKPSDVLWHTSQGLDFLGVIQSGEIIVEYRLLNQILRSNKLQAGDFVKSPKLKKSKDNHASLLARAVTDVRLYVLPNDQLTKLKSNG